MIWNAKSDVGNLEVGTVFKLSSTTPENIAPVAELLPGHEMVIELFDRTKLVGMITETRYRECVFEAGDATWRMTPRTPQRGVVESCEDAEDWIIREQLQ